MTAPKGLSHKYATHTLALQLAWPVQKAMWDLVSELAINPAVAGLDYLQVFELEAAGSDRQRMQRIVHRQEQPPYRAVRNLPCDTPMDAKVFVYVDADSDTATMMFAAEW